jgi:hypothetical protein
MWGMALPVLAQDGFDVREVLEGIGDAGFYESGLADFLWIQFVAGRFICLAKPVIYGLFKVDTAMHSRPPGSLLLSSRTVLFICLRRVHQQRLRL